MTRLRAAAIEAAPEPDEFQQSFHLDFSDPALRRVPTRPQLRAGSGRRFAANAGLQDETERPDRDMRITPLDAIVLSLMLLSGLLAMGRGLIRVLLGVLCGGVALIVASLAHSAFGGPPTSFPSLGLFALVDFFLVVAALSIIGNAVRRLSRISLNYNIHVLDRVLGGIAGLARGFAMLAGVFIFFVWLVPAAQQPDWVRDAITFNALKSVGDRFASLVPENTDNTHAAVFFLLNFAIAGILVSPIVDLAAMVTRRRPRPTPELS